MKKDVDGAYMAFALALSIFALALLGFVNLIWPTSMV